MLAHLQCMVEEAVLLVGQIFIPDASHSYCRNGGVICCNVLHLEVQLHSYLLNSSGE